MLCLLIIITLEGKFGARRGGPNLPAPYDCSANMQTAIKLPLRVLIFDY